MKGTLRSGVLFWLALKIFWGLFLSCSSPSENNQLPEGIQFDYYGQIGTDSAWYPLWVYGSASDYLPDDPRGLAGALDNDTSTAWLTKPGCGYQAEFVLWFDNLPATSVTLALGRSLWYSCPDTLWVQWNDEPLQICGSEATIRGPSPLRWLLVRLGRIPHWNYYLFPERPDSSRSFLMADHRTGFLFNSRPAGIQRLEFRGPNGRKIPVKAPPTVGMSVRDKRGTILPGLTTAWTDAAADTPEWADSDTLPSHLTLTLDRPLTIKGVRLLPSPSPKDLQGSLRLGLLGATELSLAPLPAASPGSTYSLPRPIRGSQFVWFRPTGLSLPGQIIFLTDQGPVWPAPSSSKKSLSPLPQDSLQSRPVIPELKVLLNTWICHQFSYHHYKDSLRKCFRKEASPADTLPQRWSTSERALLFLDDGRLHLRIIRRAGSYQPLHADTILENRFYGRWQLTGCEKKLCRLRVSWRSVSPDEPSWPGDKASPFQSATLIISPSEIYLERPQMRIPLPHHPLPASP